MTYELPDPKTLRKIPDEYRKCGECEKTKIDELKRSTVCCHILCQRCFSDKSDRFHCPKCGMELSKSDFVSYKKDDSLMKREKREKLPKNIKELERNDFENTPVYDDFLEKVEKLNQLMKTQNDPTKTDLYVEISSIKPKKQKERHSKRIITIKKKDSKPKDLPTGKVVVSDVIIGKEKKIDKNVLAKDEMASVSDEIKKVCGYDPQCVQQKRRYQALNWF